MALFLADQSAFFATGLGLRYTDKDFVKGKSYVYVVYARTDSKIARSDTSAVLINTSEITPIPEMPKVLIDEQDRTVKFTWNRQIASANFTGYFYERSEDRGKTYKRLNRQPYTQLTSETKPVNNSTIELNDSLPANYKPYYYRITGITAFGDYGKPTPPLPVMGRDRTPPSPPGQISAINLHNTLVKISWIKRLHEPDFSGYLIGRGENATGPYMPLVLNPLPVSATEFTDTTAVLHGTNYYVVSAIDTAGNAGVSIPAYVIMTDTIPPAKPVGLAGNIDTSGIVHIHWKRGEEPDLMGYLVYSANDSKHIFTPVTKDFLADNTFADSINLATLTKHIYYKVVAFDKNRNPGVYSDALELKRPDKVSPVAPVFNDFQLTDSTVVLRWITSNSDDVASQILYRREKGKDWVSYAKLTVKINSFIDHAVKKQTWYEYSLEAIDDAGLHSQKSFPVNVRTYDSGRRRDISAFIVTKSPDGKSLQLSWKYSEKGDYWFIIYRSINGKELMTYKNLSLDQHSLTDSNLTTGTYKYSIKAVYKDGGESRQLMSATIEFTPLEK
jgi:fibronectin type 3 domain-containing protein